MFASMILALSASGWAVIAEKDMLSNRPTAFAVLQESGARIGMFCNADTSYNIAVVIQREDRSRLSRFGSTYVTYRFDDDPERHAHWQNGNADSVSINGRTELKSFIKGIATKDELKFRARTDSLSSIDMIFNIAKNREKLAEFLATCNKP